MKATAGNALTLLNERSIYAYCPLLPAYGREKEGGSDAIAFFSFFSLVYRAGNA
jgi:hypothetical protein